MSATVVIGYDQSPPSELALLEAAREADRRNATLAVVHGYHFARPGPPMMIPPPALQRVYQKAGLEIAESAVARVREHFPDLSVTARADAGLAAQVLVDASREADVLVVGSRGRGGFAGMLLGSVSMRVLGSARCPVIVVRGSAHSPHRQIVVAIDVDEPCDEVLDFACREAATRNAVLAAVHACDEPWILDGSRDTPSFDDDVALVVTAHRRRLKALVQDRSADYPGMATTHRVAVGSAASILVEESKHADLVVAGAKHHGHAEHSTRIGPITATLLHHAECPVAVVAHRG